MGKEYKKLKANFKDSGYKLPLAISLGGIAIAIIAGIFIEKSFTQLVGMILGCFISAAGTEYFRKAVHNRKHR